VPSHGRRFILCDQLVKCTTHITASAISCSCSADSMLCMRLLRRHDVVSGSHPAPLRNTRVVPTRRSGDCQGLKTLRWGTAKEDRRYEHYNNGSRKQTALIDFDSLDATLEAHRAKNASPVRRIAAGLDPDLLRLDVRKEEPQSRRGGVQHLDEEHEKSDTRTYGKIGVPVASASGSHTVWKRDQLFTKRLPLAAGISLNNGRISEDRYVALARHRKWFLRKHERPRSIVPLERNWLDQMQILRRTRRTAAIVARRRRAERSDEKGDGDLRYIMEYIGRAIEIEDQSTTDEHKEPWAVHPMTEESGGLDRYVG